MTEIPRKFPDFNPQNTTGEVVHNDFQLLKARIMSPGQQDRVLAGMNPGPMGENRPSGHRNKEE